MVQEVQDGGDLNKHNVCKLKYPIPQMQQHNIRDYLCYEELELIAGDLNKVEGNNLSEEERGRYDEYMEAWYAVSR